MNIKQLIEKAEAGDMLSQSSLSTMYHEGDGVSQDDEKAFYWVAKAAAQGCTYSEYNLGYMYMNGNGTLKDYEKAFYWYSIAAEKGHAPAQNSVGWMYRNGAGVDVDFEEAYIWFLIASNCSLPCAILAGKQRNSNALCNLGLMHIEGNGVPESKSEAAHWINLAYIQGSERATEMLEDFELWDYIDKYYI